MAVQPQIGDTVAVTHLGRSEELGSIDARVDVGILAVELDGSGRIAGLVLEGDGSATFIRSAAVIRVEVLS